VNLNNKYSHSSSHIVPYYFSKIYSLSIIDFIFPIFSKARLSKPWLYLHIAFFSINLHPLESQSFFLWFIFQSRPLFRNLVPLSSYHMGCIPSFRPTPNQVLYQLQEWTWPHKSLNITLYPSSLVIFLLGLLYTTSLPWPR